MLPALLQEDVSGLHSDLICVVRACAGLILSAVCPTAATSMKGPRFWCVSLCFTDVSKEPNALVSRLEEFFYSSTLEDEGTTLRSYETSVKTNLATASYPRRRGSSATLLYKTKSRILP